MAQALTHRLERSIVINAPRETVFGFFTDSGRWARWWGSGSTIEARVGGQILIRHPDGQETVGEVLEVEPPRHIAFTYGYASGKLIPPGGSRVTISLEPEQGSTRLHLRHDFADAAAKEHHVQGWRFQLSLFANVVSDEVFAGAAGVVDAWFDAWAVPDERARGEAFARVASPRVSFRDRFSLLEGLEDLSAHAGAAQRFMPGIRLQRRGDVRQCQGVVLADWVAADPQGQERMSGTNVFILDHDGRVGFATGFSNPPARPR
jgi:uncharacterized protein YndB with AHSA1/START domain